MPSPHLMAWQRPLDFLQLANLPGETVFLRHRRRQADVFGVSLGLKSGMVR